MRIRRRRKKNTISFKTLVIGFVATVLLFSVGYSLLSQNLSIKGTVNLPTETTTKNEFRTDDFLLTYEINSWYNNGKTYYQYNFTLENIGVNDFSEWYLNIYLPVDTEQIGGWEARYTLDLGELLVQNLENRILESGKTTSFGYQFSTTDDKFELKKVDMNGVVIILGETGGDSGETGGDSGETGGDSGETGGGSGETGGGSGETGGGSGETGGDSGETGGDSGNDKLLDIEYTIANSWENGSEKFYQIDFSVTNNSDKNLSSWQFNAITPEDTVVIQSWNCNYVNADGVITILGISNYGDLVAGGNIKPGIIISMSSDFNLTIE